MVLRKSIFTLILIILSFHSFGQEPNLTKVYLDVDMEPLSSTHYLKKCESHIYKCLSFKSDSLIVKKIVYKHSFGKITATENTQLRSLLSKDSGEEINSNKTIIIKYYDSILNYQAIKKNYDKHVELYNYARENDTTSSPFNLYPFKHTPYNIKKFNDNQKKWIKAQSKCIKKFERSKDVTVLHAFKDSQRDLKDQENFKLIKDRSVLKNTFFKIMYNYRFLVLKPDGEYFLSGGHLDDKKLSALLKDKNWKTAKNDWTITLEKYPINGFGFFEKLEFHKSHCF